LTRRADDAAGAAILAIDPSVDAAAPTADLASGTGPGGWRLLAHASHARLTSAAHVATGPAVAGIGAGVHAQLLAALDRAALALLLLFLASSFGQDCIVPLRLSGGVVVLGALPLSFAFRLDVEVSETGEAGNQAADCRTAGGPPAGEVIEPRSIHTVLHSPATRLFALLHSGRWTEVGHQ
jgi:hypothetical protein